MNSHSYLTGRRQDSLQPKQQAWTLQREPSPQGHEELNGQALVPRAVWPSACHSSSTHNDHPLRESFQNKDSFPVWKKFRLLYLRNLLIAPKWTSDSNAFRRAQGFGGATKSKDRGSLTPASIKVKSACPKWVRSISGGTQGWKRRRVTAIYKIPALLLIIYFTRIEN